MKIALEFKLQDLWIGAYWRYDHAYYNVKHIYICVIPCFPIHIIWTKIDFATHCNGGGRDYV